MTSEEMAVLLAEEVRTYVDETLTQRLASLHEQIEKIPAPIAGEKGEKGEKGEPGPKGDAGVPGKDGDRGHAGERGDRGEPGTIGPPGEKGVAGERGERGEPGLIGKDGRDGRDGKDGIHGKDGRDGIASRDELSATVQAEVEKRLEEIVTKRVETAVAAIPIVTYKGVFTDGTEYQPGQMATWAGSLWHANTATREKPGLSDAWTLATKEGRRGKDADISRVEVQRMIDEAVRRVAVRV